MKKFTKIDSYRFADCCWISGIYKIVRYSSGEYAAYFIQDYARNWGDYVPGAPITKQWYATHGAKSSRHWPSLAAAKRGCIEHSKNYSPAAHTVTRAAEILNSLLEQKRS